MIRYIIRDKKTGKFLKRTKSYGVSNTWVDSADDATLITTASAASQIATQFCGRDQYNRQIKYRVRRVSYTNYPVEVIPVQVLLIPKGIQPFVDGVKNGHI